MNTATATPTLRELFAKYGTDKVEYADMYKGLLLSFHGKPVRLLEVGIGTPENMKDYGAPHYESGASLRAWKEYFPKGHIIGIDNDPAALSGTGHYYTEGGVWSLLADSRTFQPNGEYSIIIDDGSHDPNDQIATLANLWPSLKSGGLYVIEDTRDNGLTIGEDWKRLTTITRQGATFTGEDKRCVGIWKA